MNSESEILSEKQPVTLFLKNVVRKVFLEDWVIKVVALVISLALWLGVTGLSTPGSENYSVPLNLRTSDNSIVTGTLIEEVEIRLSGDKRRIEQINKDDLRVSLDLTDVAAGDHSVSLTPETVSITLPLGLKLDAIRPNKIPIRIEYVEEKEVAVTAETEGELPENYEIYSETVSPQRVPVRGPSSIIRSLSSVSTERIDLTNRTADFTAKQIPLNVSAARATLLQTVVDVTFRIGVKRIERIFLVAVKDQPGKRATIVLFGPKSLFENVEREDIQVEVIKNDPAVETPRAILPEGLLNKVEVRSIRLGS
ncbi:MAG: CdaR family protein [Pyrinomonadaceae bacterium]